DQVAGDLRVGAGGRGGRSVPGAGPEDGAHHRTALHLVLGEDHLVGRFGRRVARGRSAGLPGLPFGERGIGGGGDGGGRSLAEGESVLADQDLVARLERLLVDAQPVDEGAVRGPEIG